MKFQLKSSRPWYKEVISGLFISVAMLIKGCVLAGMCIFGYAISITVGVELIIGVAIILCAFIVLVLLGTLWLWATQEPDPEVEDLIRKAKRRANL